MKFLKFGEDRLYAKAHKRLKTVGDGQVTDWAMTSLWATQQGLQGYQVTGDAAALDEARRGLVGMLAATDVLMERQKLH